MESRGPRSVQARGSTSVVRAPSGLPEGRWLALALRCFHTDLDHSIYKGGQIRQEEQSLARLGVDQGKLLIIHESPHTLSPRTWL